MGCPLEVKTKPFKECEVYCSIIGRREKRDLIDVGLTSTPPSFIQLYQFIFNFDSISA